MTPFYSMYHAEQIILLLLLFGASILALVVLGIAMRYHSDFLFMGIGVASAALVFFAFERVTSAYVALYTFHRIDKSIFLPRWLLWVGCIVILAGMMAEFFYFRTNVKPTANSIKEALDNFPEGVCYFLDKGELRLCNHKMYILYAQITRDELRDYDGFISNIKNCVEHSPVKRDEGYQNVFLFPDGSVQEYREQEIQDEDGNSFIEAMFVDITKFYQAGIALQEQTQSLKETSNELKELSDNAIALTRENEILSAKTRLHDQMGAALVVLRRALTNSESEADRRQAVEMMKNAVLSIQNDNMYEKGRERMQDFMWNAEAVGVTVELTGNLPSDSDTADIFMNAMQECLTNSVKHAEADNMGIVFTEKEYENTISISSNGKLPEEPIVPRGGLKNLNRYIMRLNGYMDIKVEDRVIVEITIPKK